MCLLLLSTIILEQSALLCLTLLSWHHLNLPLRPIFSPLDFECLACVHVCVLLCAFVWLCVLLCAFVWLLSLIHI